MPEISLYGGMALGLKGLLIFKIPRHLAPNTDSLNIKPYNKLLNRLLTDSRDQGCWKIQKGEEEDKLKINFTLAHFSGLHLLMYIISFILIFDLFSYKPINVFL